MLQVYLRSRLEWVSESREPLLRSVRQMLSKRQSVFGSFALIACISMAKCADAARLIPVQVALGDQVLFEGSTSDNGEPDADEVWRFFAKASADRIEWAALDQTDQFSKAKIFITPAKDGSVTLTAPLGVHFVIDIAHGGEVAVRELILRRAEPRPERGRRTQAASNADSAAPRWYLDAKQLETVFEERRITREEAAELKDAKLPE